MRVGSSDFSLDHLVNKFKPHNMPKRVRAPNCTHVDMDRVYGWDQLCYVCGHAPSIGFLYECRQEGNGPAQHHLVSYSGHDQNHINAAKSDIRLQLESAGLSESVILTAEQGHYTTLQLEKLKAQKEELRQVILFNSQASQISTTVAKLAAMEHEPSNHDGAENSKPKPVVPQACTFKACHTCRPYWRDRIYMSFQSVLNDRISPITHEEADNRLPTKPARILQTIGTKTTYSYPFFTHNGASPTSRPTTTSLAASTDAPPTASTSSTSTFSTQSELDEIDIHHTPRRRFYRHGLRTSSDLAVSRQSTLLTRQGLKTAIQGIFRHSRASSSTGSNITLSHSTGNIRDFDIPAFYKEEREEQQRSEAGDGAEQKVRASSSEFSVLASEPGGSEVAVDGGVALTEEAVETCTPDIIEVDVDVAKKGRG